MLAEELDPGADLRIQVLPRGVEGVDVEMEQAIARQHPHQAAVLQAVDRRVHRQRADTHAGDHRLGHGVGGVDLEMRLVDAGQFLAVGTVEQPAVQRHHRVHQAQATVRGQLRRQLGEAVRGNVARRGAEDAVGLANALGDETGVRQFGGYHHGNVVALVENVGDPVGQGQVEANLRVGLAILRDGLDQVVLADAGHRVDLQRARRPRMGVARLGLGLLDVGEYLLGAHQVALPGFGQRDAPGGAMQQAGLQVGLQLGHRTGDIGGRQVQALGGGSETAGLRDADERAHIEQDIHHGPLGSDAYGASLFHATRRTPQGGADSVTSQPTYYCLL